MVRKTRAQVLKAKRNRPVSARTAARRARQRQAEETSFTSALTKGGRPTRPAETLSQARIWERKKRRYMIAGLDEVCAGRAAWGHSEGWAILPWDPCETCQPLVNAFDTESAHPKWRKCLTKLEYMTEDELSDWLDEHEPRDMP